MGVEHLRWVTPPVFHSFEKVFKCFWIDLQRFFVVGVENLRWVTPPVFHCFPSFFNGFDGLLIDLQRFGVVGGWNICVGSQLRFPIVFQ